MYFNGTQWSSIYGLSWTEFGNRTKSNSHKNIWTIELNGTFDFWILFFCKPGVENQKQTFRGSSYPSITRVFRVFETI